MRTFLPEEWENVPSKDNTPQADATQCSNQPRPPYNNIGDESTKDKVERVVRLIEQSGVDITAGYDAWIKVGFAFASEFKNSGRGYFHRVSRMNPEYNDRKTDKQYNKCLSSKGSGITIATFFQMAKDAGIDISNPRHESGHVETTVPSSIPMPTAADVPTEDKVTSTEEIQTKENGSLDLWISGAQTKASALVPDSKESVTNPDSEDSVVSEAPVGPSTVDDCDATTLIVDSVETVTAEEIQNTKNPKVQSPVIGSKWILDEEDLPNFPQFIYDSLPPFLHEVIGNSVSDDDRDMLLMGSLVCLSATLHNVSGKYYRDYTYPMLYFFVMAEAGMGKGALTYCRQLVAPINKSIRETSEQQIREFKEGMKIAKQDDKSASGEEPKRRTLFIPTNSSASAFIEQLDNNDGIGLLFDTECDTLSSVLKSDYGDYSSYLRKGYHHEPIELSRRKDNEFRNIEKPMIAVCLSGTPEQLHTLTPDSENGLFSRILYYHIPFKVEFRDTLIEDDSDISDYSLRDKFYQLGVKYQRMREAFFRGGEYHVVIPQHLCSKFNAHFRSLNQETVDEISNAMQGVTRRLAFAMFRIMMVLTAIRFMDEHPNPSALAHRDEPVRITCSDDDFHIAMAIGDTLIYHAAYCYAHLPKTIAMTGASGKILSKSDKMNTLYDTLPDRFDKSEYVAKSKQLGYSPSTTSKWINNFIVDGRLLRTGQNNYLKTSADTSAVASTNVG